MRLIHTAVAAMAILVSSSAIAHPDIHAGSGRSEQFIHMLLHLLPVLGVGLLIAALYGLCIRFSGKHLRNLQINKHPQ